MLVSREYILINSIVCKYVYLVFDQFLKYFPIIFLVTMRCNQHYFRCWANEKFLIGKELIDSQIKKMKN